MRGVIIVAGRALIQPEALAVGAALAAAGVPVHYLDANLNVSDVPKPQSGNRGPIPSRMERRARRWADYLKARLIRSPMTRALVLLRGIAADRIRLRRVFRAIRPSVVVIFDDRRARPDLVLRALAGRHGIAVTVVPFAISSVESDAGARRNKPEHCIKQTPWRFAKRWIARRWPGQVHDDARAGPLLFFGVFDTLVLAVCGLLPARPWVLGGSDPELICATDSDHRRYLQAGGVTPDRIVETGQPSLDRLFLSPTARSRLAAKQVERYGLPPDRPLVACAVPQYAEHGMTTWERHHALTDELFAALAGSDAAVLLSLHPKSKRENYAAAAARHGLAIAEERLVDLLPAADLLVGTFSSTVRWAIGLGTPAIVVDAIGTGYQLYRDLEGAVVVEGHDDLARELTRFVRDPHHRGDLRRATERGSARVGRLDGAASWRIADAIGRLLVRPAADDSRSLLPAAEPASRTSQ